MSCNVSSNCKVPPKLLTYYTNKVNIYNNPNFIKVPNYTTCPPPPLPPYPCPYPYPYQYPSYGQQTHQYPSYGQQTHQYPSYGQQAYQYPSYAQQTYYSSV